jgi:hypothetical protein
MMLFSSGFWRRVDSSVDANISEKHTVSSIIILTAVKTSDLTMKSIIGSRINHFTTEKL